MTPPNCDDTLRRTLEGLFERSRRQLCTVASRYVGQDDAEDVVQNAFVRALRFERSFRGEAAPLSWLHRIVVNDSINYCRKRYRHNALHIGQAHLKGTQFSLEDRLAVRWALFGLPRDQYQVLVMYEVSGRTHKEISVRLSIPAGTSKWRLATARKCLQRWLTSSTLCHVPSADGRNARHTQQTKPES